MYNSHGTKNEIVRISRPDCVVIKKTKIICPTRLNLAIPIENSKHSKCFMYAVDFTEALANGTKTGDPLWPKKPCSYGWEFNHSVIPYSTIATEVTYSQFFALVS